MFPFPFLFCKISLVFFALFDGSFFVDKHGKFTRFFFFCQDLVFFKLLNLLSQNYYL